MLKVVYIYILKTLKVYLHLQKSGDEFNKIIMFITFINTRHPYFQDKIYHKTFSYKETTDLCSFFTLNARKHFNQDLKTNKKICTRIMLNNYNMRNYLRF